MRMVESGLPPTTSVGPSDAWAVPRDLVEIGLGFIKADAAMTASLEREKISGSENGEEMVFVAGTNTDGSLGVMFGGR